jgi:hypothetical protein
MMDIKQASYLTSGSANWQTGLGILVQEGTTVTPFAVPIVNNEVIIP